MTDEISSARQLLSSLLAVRRAAVEYEERLAAELIGLDAEQRLSAVNLLHYLAIRQFDLRAEQRALSRRGLSSLGRSEPHVLATMDATIKRLVGDLGATDQIRHALPGDLGHRGPTAELGDELLSRRAAAALGPAGGGRTTRVMVTLPTEAASDGDLVDAMVAAGMGIARINAAHDDRRAWQAMADQVLEAASRHGRPVRVAVDLPGPKLRVGRLPPGPAVVRARPFHDALGAIDLPVRVRLVAIDSRAPERQAEIGPVDARRGETVTVPVEESIVDASRPGDVLAVVDGRGRSRLLHVIAADGSGIAATCDRTVYFVPGVRIDCRRDGELIATGAVGSLPALPGEVRLRRGEVLRVRLGDVEGTDAQRCDDGSVTVPATISVEIPELFRAVRAGHRLLIDDGRIEGVVTEIGNVHFDVEIRRPEVARVRPGKGINLPDSALNLPALARQDLDTLRGMAPVADLIALSYVADADDVDQIHAEFDQLGSKDLGVVLKIETRAAFEALPRMLLRGLRRPPVAVMIARGDLGVEVGFERLAELQEEILCLAEAAHVPVIWATQVLESLAKTGSPTRSEVSDAAWAGRAECVMLNKGPHIVDAIRFLDDVLTRMGGHGHKRTPMLRRLAVAESMGSLFAALDPDG